MIHPQIRMVDLEPDGFGIVSKLMSTFLRTPPREVHVLHNGGVVVRAVDTRKGPLPDWSGRRITSAASIRVEAGVDRVILLDETKMNELAPALPRAGAAATQDEMFVRSRRMFFDHPGVDVDPLPARGEWERWSRHLRSLGNDYNAVVAGYTDNECVFTLQARIRVGLVEHVTSIPNGMGTPSENVSTLLDRAAPVHLAAIADLDVFTAALAARSIGPIKANAIVAFGLPEDSS